MLSRKKEGKRETFLQIVLKMDQRHRNYEMVEAFIQSRRRNIRRLDAIRQTKLKQE